MYQKELRDLEGKVRELKSSFSYQNRKQNNTLGARGQR